LVLLLIGNPLTAPEHGGVRQCRTLPADFTFGRVSGIRGARTATAARNAASHSAEYAGISLVRAKVVCIGATDSADLDTHGSPILRRRPSARSTSTSGIVGSFLRVPTAAFTTRPPSTRLIPYASRHPRHGAGLQCSSSLWKPLPSPWTPPSSLTPPPPRTPRQLGVSGKMLLWEWIAFHTSAGVARGWRSR
jgi:hypothetical protein